MIFLERERERFIKEKEKRSKFLSKMPRAPNLTLEEMQPRAVDFLFIIYWNCLYKAACSVRPYVTLFIHSFLAYIYNLIRAGHAQGKTQPKVVVFRVYKILKVATIYATCYPTRYLDFSPLPYRPEPYPMSKSPTRHSLLLREIYCFFF